MGWLSRRRNAKEARLAKELAAFEAANDGDAVPLLNPKQFFKYQKARGTRRIDRMSVGEFLAALDVVGMPAGWMLLYQAKCAHMTVTEAIRHKKLALVRNIGAGA